MTYDMDMDSAFRSTHYDPNVNTLRTMCEQFDIDTLSEKEREIKRRKEQEAKRKSDIIFIITAGLLLILAMGISLLTGNEFWKGILFVIWPFPPIFIVSWGAITYGAKGIWKLLGYKEAFHSSFE